MRSSGEWRRRVGGIRKAPSSRENTSLEMEMCCGNEGKVWKNKSHNDDSQCFLIYKNT